MGVRLNISQCLDLGQQLKLMRVNQNIPLEALSDMTGRSIRQLKRYEANEVSIPHDILIEWTTLLGYDVAIVQKFH